MATPPPKSKAVSNSFSPLGSLEEKRNIKEFLEGEIKNIKKKKKWE